MSSSRRSHWSWLTSWVVVCVVSALSISCSDDDPGDPTPALASVVISPGSGTVPLGGTRQFVAAASGYSGDTTIAWQSLNEAVATVSKGLVTGVAAGTASIVAMVAEEKAIRASVQVTVVP